MILFYLLFVILVDGTDGKVAALLDQAVGGFREEGTMLHVMIANKVEHGTLGEHDRYCHRWSYRKGGKSDESSHGSDPKRTCQRV